MWHFFAGIGFGATMFTLADMAFGASLALRGLPIMDCPKLATAIGYWVVLP